MKHGFHESAADLLWQLIDETQMPRRRKSMARLAINRLSQQQKIPRDNLLRAARKHILARRGLSDNHSIIAHNLLKIIEDYDFPVKKGTELKRRERVAAVSLVQRYKWLKYDQGHDVMLLMKVR